MSTLNHAARLLLPVLFLALAGCSAKVINVDGNYPTPRVDRLPLTVGVYYADDLKNFSYTEMNEDNDKEQYIVRSGASQIRLFDQLLQGIFANVVEIKSLDNVEQDYPNVDAVFVPLVTEFQLGLPQKTHLNSYEVWIKYNMRLSELNGNQIADWVMTAYGKSPSDNSAAEGITNATNLALRDLAASFALGASSIPEVQDWLDRKGLGNG